MTLLEGRHALVTAAASGIGLAVAERFRQEGAQVSGVDVEDGAEYRHDLRDLDGIEPLVARIEAARGPLDVLCSVAGVYGPMWAVELEPGFVSTPMSIADGRNELESGWFRSVYVENRKLPLRRPAMPEEMAAHPAWLCSQQNTHLTGQVITVGGGVTITF